MSERRKVFGARVSVLGGPERLPDGVPDLMLFVGVRRIGYRIARLILHCYLGNLIAPRPVLLIAKAGMIGIELDDRIAISSGFIRVDRNHAGVNVIGEK